MDDISPYELLYLLRKTSFSICSILDGVSAEEFNKEYFEDKVTKVVVTNELKDVLLIINKLM